MNRKALALAVTAAVAVGRLADAHTIAAELLEQTRDSPGIAHSVALAVSAMADLGSGRAATARNDSTAWRNESWAGSVVRQSVSTVTAEV